MTMSFLSFFTTLFCFVLIVNASPILVAKSSLVVYTPRIITPDSSTIWKVGKKGYVSWYAFLLLSPSREDLMYQRNATDAPASISNKASIKLSGCKWEPTGSTQQRVLIAFVFSDDKPLAEGFSLRDGNVTVDIPDLPFILPGKYRITCKSLKFVLEFISKGSICVVFGDSANNSPDFAIDL